MRDSFGSHGTLSVAGRDLSHRPSRGARARGFPLARLPYALKILLENLLRREDGRSVSSEDIEALAGWDPKAEPSREIAFMPGRVLLQDFTGVPAVVDLAAMRDAMKAMGGDPEKINPLQPVELVIDHSVQVDEYGTEAALLLNSRKEFERNHERYLFLRWGQKAFRNFRVVPPATGIVHQVNLEYLARLVMAERARGRALGLPGHPGRHRLAHHDDQRPRRARLGRRRHRGRGGDARPAGVDADSAGGRLPPDRRARRGRDRDRPRAHRDPDAAQEGRGRQVRRVLRPRPRQAAPRRPRHDRQHGARVRRHLRHLPGRPGRPRLPRVHRPAGRAGRARRGLREGAGALPRRVDAGRRVHRHARARSRHASSRRSPARAGRRTGWRSPGVKQSFLAELPSLASGKAAAQAKGGDGRPLGGRGGRHRGGRGGRDRGRHRGRRRPLPAAPRLGGDRRDHLLHQHLEPVGDARRRPARRRRRSRAASRRGPGSRPASRPARRSSPTTCARPG